MKDENEKTNCHLRNFEANFTTFKNDIRITVKNNMKENMAKMDDNRTQIAQNLTDIENQMTKNKSSLNDHRTEIDKLLTEKFCLNEQKHVDLQEIFRETF